MNAHTPGPFEINGEGPVVAQLGSKRTGFRLITAPLAPALDPITEDAVEANARLLKAAPQLLHALEMVRDADDDCHRDGLSTIPAPARRRIDAAIAAAKGSAE